ncbi:MAG: hypothetical protein AB7O24_20585 [Kofleriaceae bacterium]
MAALAAGIAAGDEFVARSELRRADPMIRGLARRTLGRAMIEGALASHDSRDSVHVMRLAALGTSRRAVVNPTDTAEVARAYAELPVASMPRIPWWSIVVGLAMFAVTLTVVVAVATRPAPKQRTYVRAMPSPSATAYRDGGVPLRDPAIDDLLGSELTDLVVQAHRAEPGSLAELEPMLARVRAPVPIIQRGPALTAAWRAMIDAFGPAVVAVSTGDDLLEVHNRLREAARSVSDQFAAAGLGYFLEGRIKQSTSAMLQAYHVDEVAFVVAGGAPRKVLSLRRLDRISTRYANLGMVSDGLTDPVVFLDQIDVHVTASVLPVLAPDALYPLGDARDWMRTDAAKSLAKAIGKTVRGELQLALGDDFADATRVAQLLVERAEIVQGWRDRLDDKNIYFVATDGLYLPDTLLAQLKERVPVLQHRKVVAIEAELAELEAARIADRIHMLVTATVRRHEAQHGFDEDRATKLPYPQELDELLGAPQVEGVAIPVVASARAELAAQLSEIANDPLTPQFALWKTSEALFNRGNWGTGHCYAAIVIFEGLARQIGTPLAAGPRFSNGELDRERLIPAARALLAASGPAIRQAAAKLWLELFGEPVTKIVDR